MVKIKKIIKNGVKQLLPGNEPDFLIIGAQKSGTSSLYYYLNQHPRIVGSTPKEVCFFDRDENFEKGTKWYKKSFRSTGKIFKKKIYFEATPAYLYRSYAAERIFRYNPKLKIIVVLRDPVKRAYSSWNMYRDFLNSRDILPKPIYSGYIHDKENNLFNEFYQQEKFPSFSDAVLADIEKFERKSSFEEPSIVRRGIYYFQVKRYIELFGRENVKIIGFKDLFGINKKRILNEILSHVKLPSSDWDFLIDKKKNARDYPEKMNKEIEEVLTQFYKPHNEQLFQLLKTKLNW